MSAYNEDNSVFSEGISPIPDSSGGGAPGVTGQGGGHGGWGGSADTPHGGAPGAYDFVITGPTNFDPSTEQTTQSRGLYGNTPQAYQSALTQFGNPSVPGALSLLAPYLGPTGFALFVLGYDETERIHSEIATPGHLSILGLSHTGTPIHSRGGINRALGGSSIGHAMELWLSPADNPGWFMGNRVDDWPIDLPDWAPISGYMDDFPDAAQRVNPELNPDELDPSNFVGPFTVEKFIFDPIRRMTDKDAARIGHTGVFPNVATPGNTSSDTTPGNIPSNIFPGNPNVQGYLYDWGGPHTYFDMFQ